MGPTRPLLIDKSPRTIQSKQMPTRNSSGGAGRTASAELTEASLIKQGPAPDRTSLRSDIGGGGMKNFADDEIRIRGLVESEGISRQDAQDIVEGENSKRVLNEQTKADAKRVNTETLVGLNQISGIGLSRLTGAKNFVSHDLGGGSGQLTFDMPAGTGKGYKIGIRYDRRSDTYGLQIQSSRKPYNTVYATEEGFDLPQVVDAIEKNTGVYLRFASR